MASSKSSCQSSSRGPRKRGNLKLSEHFKLFELTGTSRQEYQGLNRTLTDEEVCKLSRLCKTILEPIRNKFNLPVMVSSGYRCKALNAAIGGSMKSQHALCEAADIIVNGLDDMEGSLHVFEWIYKHSSIPFGQLIHELDRKNMKERIWIHISMGQPYRPDDRCRQIYLMRRGEYIPVPHEASDSPS